MLAQQVLGLPSAGSGGENYQPGLLLGGARLCWLPSCASCASQTSHSICASCASCARARLSSSRPARSCHIPNLTAPSVGISSNLSARTQKSWQCHILFFFKQSPGGRWSGCAAISHLTEDLLHFWFYSKNRFWSMSPGAVLTTALLKKAFPSVFSKRSGKKMELDALGGLTYE